MAQTIQVRDTATGVSEQASIEETFVHRGDEFARVAGERVDGFVELPEEWDKEYTLVCLDCGEYDDTKEELVRVKEHTVGHEGSAELLRRIHDFKTSHDPFVREGS